MNVAWKAVPVELLVFLHLYPPQSFPWAPLCFCLPSLHVILRPSWATCWGCSLYQWNNPKPKASLMLTPSAAGTFWLVGLVFVPLLQQGKRAAVARSYSTIAFCSVFKVGLAFGLVSWEISREYGCFHAFYFYSTASCFRREAPKMKCFWPFPPCCHTGMYFFTSWNTFIKLSLKRVWGAFYMGIRHKKPIHC